MNNIYAELGFKIKCSDIYNSTIYDAHHIETIKSRHYFKCGSCCRGEIVYDKQIRNILIDECNICKAKINVNYESDLI